MNRTKVTVACRACQKKKVKCTGVSPCSNCLKTNLRCEFTGTAKKRGPRNGNVEVIKSSARRIEYVMRKNPNLRDQINHMLAHSNARPDARSARPSSVIPHDVPIVLVEDDSGITTDASQSHGIPPSIRRTSLPSNSIPPMQEYFSPDEHVSHPSYNPETINLPQPQSPALLKPVPVYPMRNHVANERPEDNYSRHNPTYLGSNFVPIPPMETLQTSTDRMKLPMPNLIACKKRSTPMPIVITSSGIEVLLPPAPDLANPLSPPPSNQNQNQYPIDLPPLALSVPYCNKSYPDMNTPPMSTVPLPSPSSSSDLYNMTFEKSQEDSCPPTPPNSLSPPLSPRDTCLHVERPMTWMNKKYSFNYSQQL
ncbi:9629_t:CDS:2 [Funneliformis caledonium]|uniref:9629_t:CDS:1 n=1 Tax=Funneliformis caledonium TaxID=1117310 RepID=A0A9N9E5B0_9GLOM|nr:9629_t:CDS:2 [Funneliformis caledonium]